LTANQLIGRRWSLGAQYRLSKAVLNENFVDVPSGTPNYGTLPFTPRQRLEGILQQINLSAIYNHPSGFFAQGEARWYAQSNSGYSPTEGDDFWQLNTFVGYRFPRRKAELLLGVLNLTDQDYHLNPLNLYNELPRSRTLELRLQFNF